MKNYIFAVMTFLSLTSFATEELTEQEFRALSTAEVTQLCSRNGNLNLFQLSPDESSKINKFLSTLSPVSKQMMISSVMRRAQLSSHSCQSMSDKAAAIFLRLAELQQDTEQNFGIDFTE